MEKISKPSKEKPWEVYPHLVLHWEVWSFNETWCFIENQSVSGHCGWHRRGIIGSEEFERGECSHMLPESQYSEPLWKSNYFSNGIG